jgi:hypothetical protein
MKMDMVADMEAGNTICLERVDREDPIPCKEESLSWVEVKV